MIYTLMAYFVVLSVSKARVSDVSQTEKSLPAVLACEQVTYLYRAEALKQNGLFFIEPLFLRC